MKERYDPKEAEPRLQALWAKRKLHVFDPKSKKPLYSIDTPPLTMSGLLHMGHLIGYVPMDFIARYKRMKGFNIFYPMGFDSNGLATERYVEKMRNVRGSQLSRDEFRKICLEEVERGEAGFRHILESLGMSYNWDQLYSTISDFGIRISQRSFIDLYEQGRVYRQEGPVTWCPQCQTAIAQAELEDMSRETILNTIEFKMKGSNEKIKIATTRPELLAACVAVFVHPHDQRYKGLVSKRAVVPIFDYDVPIIADEKVDPNFGTGIVMVCTFGDRTDIEWWQQHKLPLKIAIDRSGRLTHLAGEFEGMRIEEARRSIVDRLMELGQMIDQKNLDQSVNIHDKCGTPAEFHISQQWYIRVLDMKEKWMELGMKVRWFPEHMSVRYKQWVEGLNSDWCISRQRYFGVQFPAWHCKKCGETALAEESQLPVDPIKTKPKKKCKCGSNEFVPDTDIMDTWTTSAITPLINAKWGEKDSRMKMIPMTARTQGHDIIRTWAFYTIVKSWLHAKTVPWLNAVINGHGLDPHGKKMSKSKGNVVEPPPVVEKYSADAIRFWAASAKLGYDMFYQEKDVANGQKTVTKLWNAGRIVSQAKAVKKPKALKPIDRWLLAKLMSAIKVSTKNFEVYEYAEAKRETEMFFWQTFADNYLEIIKHRLYGEKRDDSLHWTLRFVFTDILKLYSPFLPHVTEELYQELYKPKDSIHLSEWPECDKTLADQDAAGAGDMAVAIVSSVRKWKHDNNLALNAPLKEIIIDCSAKEKRTLEDFIDDIKGTVKAEKAVFGRGEFSVDGTALKIKIVV